MGTASGGAGGGGSGGAGAYVQGHGIFRCTVSQADGESDSNGTLVVLGLVALGLVARKRRAA